MTRIALYPYPRFDRADVAWGGWAAALADHHQPLDQVADNWDANADLSLKISVHVSAEALARLSLSANGVKLVATVACRDTSYTATCEEPLRVEPTGLEAQALVRVRSRNVSERLDLRACLIASQPGEGQLARRILANGPDAQVALDSSLSGFPTVAYSFVARGLPSAPWRLVIDADDVEAPFAHSVRLELNEDNERVRALMAGKPDAFTDTALVASITRVLIGTVARMLDSSMEARSPETIAAEAPDSITAAAARASSQYLRLPLSSAIRDYRLRPERFEYALSSGVGLLEGGRSSNFS